jgi:hypothetical protein
VKWEDECDKPKEMRRETTTAVHLQMEDKLKKSQKRNGMSPQIKKSSSPSIKKKRDEHDGQQADVWIPFVPMAVWSYSLFGVPLAPRLKNRAFFVRLSASCFGSLLTAGLGLG